MSERGGYEHGTPCWVDHSSTDPQKAADFYTAFFGWEAEDMMPPDAPVSYLICRLRGHDVAAIGSQQAEDAPASWNTYVWVDDADDAAAKAQAAGGTVVAEPFDVFDAGRMAAMQDQAGAWIHLWQAGRQRGAGLVNEPGTLSWNELTTRDPDGSKQFYGAIFGWQAAPMDLDGVEYTLWHPPGEIADSAAALGGMMPMIGDMWPAEMPNHWMTYFAVEDADAACARCQELGGAVPVPPFDTPVGRSAVLSDPLGAVLSVIALKAPSA